MIHFGNITYKNLEIYDFLFNYLLTKEGQQKSNEYSINSTLQDLIGYFNNNKGQSKIYQRKCISRFFYFLDLYNTKLE